ncbi:hypothetical protein NO1_1895 [Candidatus Termititenax aidoneus]|uniref:Uncharacterized protein n=1 Tax=Termititenax aidoneus TaxID=2218524 RepID=A0A388TFE0_TERA1|nr:hypothetical protein NO1_1895 [Candidatus Termititenax aidoneus]
MAIDLNTRPNHLSQADWNKLSTLDENPEKDGVQISSREKAAEALRLLLDGKSYVDLPDAYKTALKDHITQLSENNNQLIDTDNEVAGVIAQLKETFQTEENALNVFVYGVQNQPKINTHPAAQDFDEGAETYNGHKLKAFDGAMYLLKSGAEKPERVALNNEGIYPFGIVGGRQQYYTIAAGKLVKTVSAEQWDAVPDFLDINRSGSPIYKVINGEVYQKDSRAKIIIVQPDQASAENQIYTLNNSQYTLLDGKLIKTLPEQQWTNAADLGVRDNSFEYKAVNDFGDHYAIYKKPLVAGGLITPLGSDSVKVGNDTYEINNGRLEPAHPTGRFAEITPEAWANNKEKITIDGKTYKVFYGKVYSQNKDGTGGISGVPGRGDSVKYNDQTKAYTIGGKPYVIASGKLQETITAEQWDSINPNLSPVSGYKPFNNGLIYQIYQKNGDVISPMVKTPNKGYLINAAYYDVSSDGRILESKKGSGDTTISISTGPNFSNNSNAVSNINIAIVPDDIRKQLTVDPTKVVLPDGVEDTPENRQTYADRQTQANLEAEAERIVSEELKNGTEFTEATRVQIESNNLELDATLHIGEDTYFDLNKAVAKLGAGPLSLGVGWNNFYAPKFPVGWPIDFRPQSENSTMGAYAQWMLNEENELALRVTADLPLGPKTDFAKGFDNADYRIRGGFSARPSFGPVKTSFDLYYEREKKSAEEAEYNSVGGEAYAAWRAYESARLRFSVFGGVHSQYTWGTDNGTTDGSPIFEIDKNDPKINPDGSPVWVEGSAPETVSYIPLGATEPIEIPDVAYRWIKQDGRMVEDGDQPLVRRDANDGIVLKKDTEGNPIIIREGHPLYNYMRDNEWNGSDYKMEEVYDANGVATFVPALDENGNQIPLIFEPEYEERREQDYKTKTIGYTPQYADHAVSGYNLSASLGLQLETLLGDRGKYGTLVSSLFASGAMSRQEYAPHSTSKNGNPFGDWTQTQKLLQLGVSLDYLFPNEIFGGKMSASARYIHRLTLSDFANYAFERRDNSVGIYLNYIR